MSPSGASDLLRTACELLYREAECIDERRWDEWLALYIDDCVFWVPSWVTDEAVCTDPSTEISLIYYASRSGLEDRVARVRSGRSIASVPAPRTVHSITNTRLLSCSEALITARSSWAVDLFSVKSKSSQRFFGYYEHTLRQVDGAWRISAKKATLLNDYLPSSLDFYCV